MDSTSNRSDKPHAADAAGSRPLGLQPRSAGPARLPRATADLVNRMLAARCGRSR